MDSKEAIQHIGQETFHEELKKNVKSISCNNHGNQIPAIVESPLDSSYQKEMLKRSSILQEKSREKINTKIEEIDLRDSQKCLIEIIDKRINENEISKSEEEDEKDIPYDMLSEINMMTNNTLNKGFLTELTKDICSQRELINGDIFINSNPDLKGNWIFYFKNDQKYLYNSENSTRWYFCDIDLLLNNYPTDVQYQRVSVDEHTKPTENLANGNACLDEFGNLHLKYWANTNEEKKNFKFIKIPKSFLTKKNNFTSTSMRATLEILYRRYKKPKDKKKYRPREKTKPKEDRKPGAGRKVRSDDLERFIQCNLKINFDESKIKPERQDCLKYARQWKYNDSSIKFGNFKASKGWLDKFIKRNKKVFDSWSDEHITENRTCVSDAKKYIDKITSNISQAPKFNFLEESDIGPIDNSSKMDIEDMTLNKKLNEKVYFQDEDNKSQGHFNYHKDTHAQDLQKNLIDNIKLMNSTNDNPANLEVTEASGPSQQLVNNLKELSRFIDLDKLINVLGKLDHFCEISVTDDSIDDLCLEIFNHRNYQENILIKEFEVEYIKYQKYFTKLLKYKSSNNNVSLYELREMNNINMLKNDVTLHNSFLVSTMIDNFTQKLTGFTNEDKSMDSFTQKLTNFTKGDPAIDNFDKKLNIFSNANSHIESNKFKKVKDFKRNTKSDGNNSAYQSEDHVYDFDDIYIGDLETNIEESKTNIGQGHFEFNTDQADFYYKDRFAIPQSQQVTNEVSKASKKIKKSDIGKTEVSSVKSMTLDPIQLDGHYFELDYEIERRKFFEYYLKNGIYKIQKLNRLSGVTHNIVSQSGLNKPEEKDK